MIVQYIGGEDFPDKNFTIGKEYVLIGISYYSYEDFYKYELISDQKDFNYPELIHKKFNHFKIINLEIPPNWSFYLNDNHICLCPMEFLGDFTEEYEDNNPDAIKTFRRVVNETYAFHGLDPLYKDPVPQTMDYIGEEWWKEYVTDEPAEAPAKTVSVSLQNSLGLNTINRILRKSPILKTMYYDRLDHHTQCQIEKATLDQKWQSLGESLLYHLQRSTVDPDVIIDTLHQTEIYLVQQENKARHVDVKELFLRPLIDWIRTIGLDDARYSSARLVLRNLGPFCEQYISEIDPEIQAKILQR